MPGLDGGVLVRQETQTKMTRLLAIQCEAVHTFCGVRRDEILQEEMEVVFCSVFVFLVSHQFLHSAGRGLYMIDNQFIQIGVHVRGIDNKLTPHILTSGISIAFSDIDMLVELIIHLPRNSKVVDTFRRWSDHNITALLLV